MFIHEKSGWRGRSEARRRGVWQRSQEAGYVTARAGDVTARPGCR